MALAVRLGHVERRMGGIGGDHGEKRAAVADLPDPGERLPLAPGETPAMKRVRFRTLGCYPLTGAIESAAQTLDDIIEEMRTSRSSERQGRVIDRDGGASMEKKKQEGYF